MSTQLVWLITGTSSGLGKQLALEALARGDKVIATARARSLAQLEELKAAGAETLELDVTAPLDDLKKVAEKAEAFYGRVDVVVNNAGYIAFGALEENTPEETLAQFNTNVFGALNVSRAFLPSMRARKSGTIVWLGSVGGWHGGAGVGLYCASKHTIRCLSESLHEELQSVAPGLRSIIFELGYFRTSFLTPNNRSAHEPRITDYAGATAAANDALISTGFYPWSYEDTGLKKLIPEYNQNQPGSPEKGCKVMVDVLRGEGLARGRPFPTVLQLGSDCNGTVKQICEQAIQRIEEWKDIGASTDIAT